MNLARSLPLLPALLAASVPAAAQVAAGRNEDQGLNYVVTAGATHSDNAGRTRLDNETETSLEMGLNAGLNYERERTLLLIDADLRFLTHSYGTYRNELRGGLAGSAAFELFREALRWVAEENYGQSLINSQDIDTPNNTQDVNIFSTGPDIALPLGGRTAVLLQGRVTDVTYQESDFGNRRLSGLFGLRRQIGENSSISLNGTTERVLYKDLPSASDYRIHSGYVSWEAVGAKTRLDLSAGYTTLKEVSDSTSGNTFALELVRQMTQRTTLSLFAGRDFGDSADALKRDQGIRGVAIGGRPAIASSDPMRSDYASLRWDAGSGRSAILFSANWRRENHQRDSNLDRQTHGGTVEIRRQLSPRLSFGFSTSFTSEEYSQAAIDFDEWGAGLALSWAWSPTFGFGVDWNRLVGNGDTSLGPGTRDYIENRYSARLNWSPKTR